MVKFDEGGAVPSMGIINSAISDEHGSVPSAGIINRLPPSH